MISLLFFVLASVCNAIMDVISHHWDQCVFKRMNLNPQYWNPAISWRNKYISGSPIYGRKKWLGINIHESFTDAWHFFKSLMIIFICLSIAFSYHWKIALEHDYKMLTMLAIVIVFGTVWNFVFSLFYKKILM